MKITASTEHTTVTIEEHGVDLTTHDFLDIVRRVAIALGYHEISWRNAICDLASQYDWQDRR